MSKSALINIGCLTAGVFISVVIAKAQMNPAISYHWIVTDGWVVPTLGCVVMICFLAPIREWQAFRKFFWALAPRIVPLPAGGISCNAQPRISIGSHSSGDTVGLHEVVSGIVESSNARVYVGVFGGNKKWFFRRADVRGNTWRVKWQFGDEGKSGGQYQIVAVTDTKEEIEFGFRSTLPDGIKSEAVTVVRTS